MASAFFIGKDDILSSLFSHFNPHFMLICVKNHGLSAHYILEIPDFCRKNSIFANAMTKNMDIDAQVSLEYPSNEAILSSGDGYTIFRFGGYNVRFKAPYSLERYLSVKEWDNGYIVVMAKYKHRDEPEEEYIDLDPILEGLYIDKTEFLRQIKKVSVHYA